MPGSYVDGKCLEAIRLLQEAKRNKYLRGKVRLLRQARARIQAALKKVRRERPL